MEANAPADPNARLRSGTKVPRSSGRSTLARAGWSGSIRRGALRRVPLKHHEERVLSAGDQAIPTPSIIQGGMGVAISSWRLARAVARHGQLGTVSGTALSVVLARRLQDGDRDGSVRRALSHLPLPGVAERLIERYFVESGIGPDRPYAAVPRPTLDARLAFTELTVAANFVEVFLAKEGHEGLIGANYLHKVRLPTPASLYGALLAGVDYVAMGAGIPRDIPALLDDLAQHRPVSLRVPLVGDGAADAATLTFDPATLWPPGASPPALRRPPFLAIVASATLAKALAREESTRPDGFIIEGPTAGGHNAPPRGRAKVDASGELRYGPRDTVDPGDVAELGLPFWLAGGYGNAGGLRRALEVGASGVQIGTLFALCADSGMAETHRRALLDEIRAGGVRVRTDPLASPTGFPFKIAMLESTLSDEDVLADRRRICDLGFLSEAYARPDGRIGYRCPAEPLEDYVRKGGAREDTEGRVCLCNALTSTAGLPQRRAGSYVEPAIVTLGDGLDQVEGLLARHGGRFTAADVIDYVRGPS